MTWRDIVLATRNFHKVIEIRAALADLPVRLLSLDDFPAAPEVTEDGATLQENAIKKARSLYQFTGLPSLADDTGLMVAVLNGAPGVHSSRYAGPQATYADNVRKLLQALEGFEMARRQAEFRTVIAFAHENKIQLVDGACSGTIAFAPTGEGGFGYDPIFIADESGKTFAEMTVVEKNRISHRGRALQVLRKMLAEWLSIER